jgi:hypothetical protein
MYNHCNICNILIYFCNIRMKHLKHTYGTYEILETYAHNMGKPRAGRFQSSGSKPASHEHHHYHHR